MNAEYEDGSPGGPPTATCYSAAHTPPLGPAKDAALLP